MCCRHHQIILEELLMAKFFERNSTKLTVSEFYDNYILKKYNFDASYQRKSDVWAEDKKSFLIDSILKNYPIPAIFMRPIVDNNGKTKYDIVDGKQRLQAIISFIEEDIPLTTYFAEDRFLDEQSRNLAENIAGKKFEDIKKEKGSGDYVKQFWTYTLQIEYLYEDDLDLVSSVFDRLNRNGEPLNPQELRNAKYSTTPLLKLIKELSNISFLKDKRERLKIERMEDEEFVSELLFLVLNRKALDSKPAVLEAQYEKYKDDMEILGKGAKEFNRVIEFMESLELDYENNKRLCWTTHLYTLFSFCWYCVNNDIEAEKVKNSVLNFYNEYFSRNTKYTGYLKEYKDAASSRTRSASQKNNRMNALLKYCSFNVAEEI
ncbi:DUF262 domain-containing protein [bacterium 1xD8-6]|nr:DUF262 domain-containing protein [bacterium D16-36]RKI66326.1 DUF262 domain-containing protein [bacterium 1xD8-6]